MFHTSYEQMCSSFTGSHICIPDRKPQLQTISSHGHDGDDDDDDDDDDNDVDDDGTVYIRQVRRLSPFCKPLVSSLVKVDLRLV